jgi:acetylglutamate kinase
MAERLILMTDVDGVKKPDGGLLSSIDTRRVDGMIAEKTVSGGMIPKLECATDALKSGVGKAHIINGKIPHALLLEIFTDKGIGTEVTA